MAEEALQVGRVMSYLPLILGSWSIVATLVALLLALEVGVLRRRVQYLEALAAGDWETVDRMMGIAADPDAAARSAATRASARDEEGEQW